MDNKPGYMDLLKSVSFAILLLWGVGLAMVLMVASWWHLYNYLAG